MSRIFRLSVIAAVLLAALALAACGGKKTRLVPQLAPIGSGGLQAADDAHRVAPPIQAAISLDEALAELEGMECPEGVDEALWGELKDALEEALLTQAESRLSSRDSTGSNSGLESPDSTVRGPTARFASTPPTGDANRVNDLAISDNGDGTYTLTWHYRNLGDYDQNGTVAVEDIIPLALHYGEEVLYHRHNSLQAVIDGSNNGCIGIEDITPIAMNFAVDVHHYALEGALEEEGPWEPIQEIMRDSGIGDGRLEFLVELDALSWGLYRVVPYDDQGVAGIPGVVASVAPVIHSISPLSGTEGAEVVFTADVTGAWPLTYEWDFGGGAVPNVSGDSSPRVTMGLTGTYDARLTVANNAGEDDLEFTLTVSHPRGAWWMYGHDARHTHRSEFVGPQEPTVKWRHSITTDCKTGLVVGSDGEICIGNGHQFYSINPMGYEEWLYGTYGSTTSLAAVAADGTVYVGYRSGDEKGLCAFSPEGTLIWHAEIGSVSYSSPVIGDDGTIYIGTRRNGFYDGFCAINRDGSTKWTYTEIGDISTSAAIGADGAIYVGSEDRFLYAFNPDGTLKWKYEFPYTLQRGRGSPSVGKDGCIYVAVNSLTAINPDGTLRWSCETGGTAEGPAIGMDGTIYIPGLNNKFHAVSHDGTLKWSFETEDGIYTRPAVDAEDTIYFGCRDGYIYALNRDGTLKWRYLARDCVSADPCIGADGTLYVASEDGFVYAFGDAEEQCAEWMHTWGGDSRDRGYGIAADSTGGILVAGSTCSFGAGDEDVLLLTYDSSGSLLQAKTWGTTKEEKAYGTGLDGNGNIFVMGLWSMHPLVLKLDANLNPQWARAWKGEFADWVNATVVDSMGNTYFAGGRSDVMFSPWIPYLLKYNAQGDVEYSMQLNPGYSMAVKSLAIDSNGYLYLGGTLEDFEGDLSAGLLMKFDVSGTLLEAKTITGDFRCINDMCLDDQDNLYAACGTRLLKFGPDGVLLWAGSIDIPESAYIKCMAVRDDGTLYIGGGTRFYGGSDLLVLTVDSSSGLPMSCKVWNGVQIDEAYAVAFDGDGNAYFAGRACFADGYWFDLPVDRSSVSITFGSIECDLELIERESTVLEGTVDFPEGIVDLGGGDSSDVLIIKNPPF